MLKGNYLILVMGNNKINTILLTIKFKKCAKLYLLCILKYATLFKIILLMYLI